MEKTEILKIIDDKYKAEEEVKKIKTKLAEAANNLELRIFDDCDYESAKKIYNSIKYCVSNKNIVEKIATIVEAKKIEQYPALLKPTYYPEIDMLDISDSEKLKLDKVAKQNFRNYISKNNAHKLNVSLHDMILLSSVGIAEKRYDFMCKKCGCSCDIVSEKDLIKHKRAWELEKKCSELTDEQKEELSKLYEDGFSTIFVCCVNCDEFDESICSEAELKGYESYINILYKIVKEPNLKYENL